MSKNDLLKYLDERIALWRGLEYHTKTKELVQKYRAIRHEVEDIKKTIDENWD